MINISGGGKEVNKKKKDLGVFQKTRGLKLERRKVTEEKIPQVVGGVWRDNIVSVKELPPLNFQVNQIESEKSR